MPELSKVHSESLVFKAVFEGDRNIFPFICDAVYTVVNFELTLRSVEELSFGQT